MEDFENRKAMFYHEFLKCVRTKREYTVEENKKLGSEVVDCIITTEYENDYGDGEIRESIVIDYIKDTEASDIAKDEAVARVIREETVALGKSCKVSILHLTPDTDVYAYTYLLPYLVGIETSLSYQFAKDALDWHILIDED